MPITEGTKLKSFIVTATNSDSIQSYNPRRVYEDCIDGSDAVAKMISKSGITYDSSCKHQFRSFEIGTIEYKAAKAKLDADLPEAIDDGPTIDDLEPPKKVAPKKKEVEVK